MNRTQRLILVILLCGPLIAACSFDRNQVAQQPKQPSPTARPLAVQSGVTINGRLLFVQDGNLYLHQGQSTRQITKDGLTRDPVWSPDGSKIAYVRREESYSDIYLLNGDGGLPTQVTFNRGRSQPWTQAFMHEVVWAVAPSWTPDGARLTFLSQIRPPTTESESPPLYDYPLSIYNYRVNLIGKREPSNDDLLVRASEADFQRPVWSPDGSALAVVRVPRNNDPKQIVLFDPNTDQTSAYPGIPDNAYDPAWSPDGRWLAFAAVTNGQTDIWAILSPTIGGTAVRLTNSGTARDPVWSPDGSQLAFVQVGDTGTDLYVMPLKRDGGTISGGQATPLTSNGQIDANSGLSWGK